MHLRSLVTRAFFVAALVVGSLADASSAAAQPFVKITHRARETNQMCGTWEPKDCAYIGAINTYPNMSVWVTIYNNGSIVTAKCVYALRSKAFGGFYKAESVKLRAEVMESDDCKGKKRCDTNVSEVRPGAAWAIHQNEKDPNNCYWDQDIKWEDWRIK